MKRIFFITSFFLLFIISCSSPSIKNNKNILHEEPKKGVTVHVKKESIISSKEDEKEIEIGSIEKLQKERPYDWFDTILSNGYYLSFSYFQYEGYISKCLILKKGGKYIDTLSIMGYGAPDKNLGCIGGDFNEYFAFVQSFGVGNPHEMQLLMKSTGEKIREGFFVKKYHSPDLLFYEDTNGKLKIFDFSTKKDIDISSIDPICPTWQLDYFLTIDSVTTDMIFLEFENHEEKKLKYKFER